MDAGRAPAAVLANGPAPAALCTSACVPILPRTAPDRVSRASNYFSGVVADSFFPYAATGKDYVTGVPPPLNGHVRRV